MAACGTGRIEPAPTPDLCKAADCSWQRLGALLDSAVSAGAAPGGVVAVSHRGRHFLHATGRLALDDPARPDGRTLYDLASLTKVVATTTLTMLAVNDGRLELDRPAAAYVPVFRGPGKEAVTVRHLLTHSSGLPADRPLWRQASDARAALALVTGSRLDTVPGTRMVYSDLGAIVLGLAVERALGGRLDRLARTRIFVPLGMRNTRFRPPASLHHRVAATEYDTAWRKRIVRGEVHDEKAAFLGGVAGHAGLFGSAQDLLAFGEWMLDAVGRSDALGATAREFTRRQGLVPGSSRALGWDTPSPGSSAGTRLHRSSFGHTGFTGTSIWIDPTRDLVVVLLTNRVHPTRANTRQVPLRIAVADLAASLADSGSPVDPRDRR
ncbi:MAG: serine hydrolase domain-containing protein [Gemmatimonadales bacterium]